MTKSMKDWGADERWFSLIAKRWMTNQGRLSKKQINAVFQRFDTDGDGTLSFKEFKK